MVRKMGKSKIIKEGLSACDSNYGFDDADDIGTATTGNGDHSPQGYKNASEQSLAGIKGPNRKRQFESSRRAYW